MWYARLSLSIPNSFDFSHIPFLDRLSGRYFSECSVISVFVNLLCACTWVYECCLRNFFWGLFVFFMVQLRVIYAGVTFRREILLREIFLESLYLFIYLPIHLKLTMIKKILYTKMQIK